MTDTLFFSKTNEAINYHSRTSTQGEELKMVKGFISSFLSKKKKRNVAIFIEPQLPSGYPDIVIVEYSTMRNLQYNEDRFKLNDVDLRILFHIMQFNSISQKQIEFSLGFSRQRIEKAIYLLQKSDMIKVSPTGNYIRKREVKSFFKITNIISIEAKIGKWHDVVDQSYTNQWFSSQSYILLNNCPTPDCEEICKKEGVGILYADGKGYQIFSKSNFRKLPVSFMSLQFNEWIYRKEIGGGSND